MGSRTWAEARQRESHRQKEMERHNKWPHTPSWSEELRERKNALYLNKCIVVVFVIN